MSTTRTTSTGLLHQARRLTENARALDAGATLTDALEAALEGEQGVVLVGGEPQGEVLRALEAACGERGWQAYIATGIAEAAKGVTDKLRRAVIVEHNAVEFLRTLPVKPCVSILNGEIALSAVADASCDGGLAIVLGGHTEGNTQWDLVRPGDGFALLARASSASGVMPVRLDDEVFGRLSDLTRRALSEGPTPAPEATMRTPAVVAPAGFGSHKTRHELVKMVTHARDVLVPKRDRRLLKDLSRWPWVVPQGKPLPPTMPDGSPWPKISIVTPTYNQGHFIEETILSIIHQGYPNLEHILMDGKSTDDTMEVVDRYRDHFSVIVSEKDDGQSDAINKGFERATGDIFTWINSDDMVAPGALAAAAIAFKTSGADFINGISQVFREDRMVHQCITSCGEGPMPLQDMLDLENCWLTGQFWWQPDCFFTKDLWDRAGSHVRVDWYYSMDYELWLRMAQAGARVHSIGRPIVWFRTHEDQKTSEGDGGGFKGELPKVVIDHCEKHGIVREERPKEQVKQRLRVAFFNDVGFEYGAGIAHKRLAQAFALAGHEVHAVAATHPEPIREHPSVSAGDVLTALKGIDPDLVVIGNVHGADVSPEVLGAIAAEHETVFLMHDMWLLTGKQTYTADSTHHLDGTVSEEAIKATYPRLPADRIRWSWETNRRFLTGSDRLTVLTNSRWLAHRTEEALEQPNTQENGQAAFDLGGRTSVLPIALGLDTKIFKPRDKATCRDALGLPQDDFLIMASACSLDDERKGIAHLAKALKQLNLPDATVVGVGYVPPNAKPPIPGMRAMGYMRDPQQLAMLYSACDLFVAPSTDEAFGQVFIEAAACGTPAIGFPVGGVPEAVTHGVTGLVAREVSAEALAEAIDTLYRDDAYRRNLGQWARIHAENEWSLFTSYQRIHVALTQSGAGKRIGLSRKIDFTRPAPVPEQATLLPTTGPAYEPRFGFDHWEGPNQDQNLGRFRWLRGTSAAVLHAHKAGSAKLAITCRNLHKGQRLRVVLNGSVVHEDSIPVTAPRTDHALTLPVKVSQGANHLQLHLWKWNQAQGRPIALMLTDLRLIED